MDEDCLFCRKFGTDASSRQDWFDRELLADDEFVVTAGLGPIGPGYLLIVSRDHYAATSSLEAAQIDVLERLKDEVRDVVSSRFGPVIVFEHGPGASRSGAGSCIDHLHLHVQASETDLIGMIRGRRDVELISRLHDLQRYRGTSYLFLEDQEGQMHVGAAGNVGGQYVRRLLYEAGGRPDEWDYLTFPNYGAIGTTIKELTPWPQRP